MRKPTPILHVSEELLRDRVRRLQFFTCNKVGSCLRNDLGPDNTVQVLRCFFPNKRTMMLWLLFEWARETLVDLRWWLFWFWHKTILRRSKSQIEVILENHFVEEMGETEQIVFDEEEA